MAVQLGLQYRILTGGLGFYPLKTMLTYMGDLFDKRDKVDEAWKEAQKDMPKKDCCKNMVAKCAACWTDSTIHDFCTKWRGALPECPEEYKK